jgi:predicted kinase
MRDARGLKAIILVGAQGSGKSTYAKKIEKEYPRTMRATKDDIRYLAYDRQRYAERYDECNKRFGMWVTRMHLDTIDVILRQQLDVIWDECNCLAVTRTGIVEYLRHNYPNIYIEAHYIHSSLERCLKRNAKRAPHKVVPEDTVAQFHAELTESVGPLNTACSKFLSEGFDGVKIVY